MNYCLFVEYLACNFDFNAFCEYANLLLVATNFLGAKYTNSHVCATKIMSNCAENCLCPF